MCNMSSEKWLMNPHELTIIDYLFWAMQYYSEEKLLMAKANLGPPQCPQLQCQRSNTSEPCLCFSADRRTLRSWTARAWVDHVTSCHMPLIESKPPSSSRGHFELPREYRRRQGLGVTWRSRNVKPWQAPVSILAEAALPMQQMWTRRSRGEQRHWSCGHGKIRRVFLASALRWIFQKSCGSSFFGLARRQCTCAPEPCSWPAPTASWPVRSTRVHV